METSEAGPCLSVQTAGSYPYAWITCTDGSESSEFATVDRGLAEMAKLAIAGKISTGSAFGLTEEIMASGLEPKDAELDELFDTMQAERKAFFAQLREAQRQKWENDVPNRNPRREARGKRTLH